MNPLFRLLMAAMLLQLAIACNGSIQKSKADNTSVAAQHNEAESKAPADGITDVAAADSVTPDEHKHVPANKNLPDAPLPGDNPDWNKKIVKTGNMVVEAKNFQIFDRRLHEKVRGLGGYIAKEDENKSDTRIENALTIKIPVDKFDETILDMPSDSDRLISKNISTEDVTGQILDVRSRMETKKEARERYLALLRQAHSTKEIIQIQEQIDNIQEDIEGASGRVAYLGHAASYSTINLDYYQLLNAAAPEETDPPFLRAIGNAMAGGWKWVSTALISIVRVWPLLIIAVIIGIWLRRRQLLKPVH